MTVLILFLSSSFHLVMTLEKFHIFIFNVRLRQKSKHVSVQSSLPGPRAPSSCWLGWKGEALPLQSTGDRKRPIAV